MLPVAENVLVEGLYNSAVAVTALPEIPPVINTSPLFRRVAVCSAREIVMLPAV